MRRDTAEKCSCMSNPPSGNEVEGLLEAGANAMLRILGNSEAAVSKEEKEPPQKWRRFDGSECSCVMEINPSKFKTRIINILE